MHILIATLSLFLCVSAQPSFPYELEGSATATITLGGTKATLQVHTSYSQKCLNLEINNSGTIIDIILSGQEYLINVTDLTCTAYKRPFADHPFVLSGGSFAGPDRFQGQLALKWTDVNFYWRTDGLAILDVYLSPFNSAGIPLGAYFKSGLAAGTTIAFSNTKQGPIDPLYCAPLAGLYCQQE